MRRTIPLTLNLPAPLQAALQEEADASGQTVEQTVVEALLRQFAVFSEGDEELRVALQEGLSDVRAGRLVTLEEGAARMEELLAGMPETRQKAA